MRFLVAIIGVTLGIVYLKYNYRITNLLGQFPTVEKILGPGNTYAFHKILAILVIVGSIMWAFGTLQTGTQGLVGPYFNVGQ